MVGGGFEQPAWSSEIKEFLMSNMVVVKVFSMLAVAFYCSLEVALSCLDIFKRYWGLYFFSMMVASCGILLFITPIQVYLTTNTNELAMVIPSLIGNCCMVIGQPVVLYSRLHLIVQDVCRFRWVLWMIIINSISLPIPGAALNYAYTFYGRCRLAASIVDRVQVVAFTVQDLIICSIYIVEAFRALGPILEFRGKGGRNVIIYLIAVNVVIMMLDALLLVGDLKEPYLVVSLRALIYGLKLKLEFTVLNKLRSLMSSHNSYALNSIQSESSGCRNSRCSGSQPSRRSSELKIHAIYNMLASGRTASQAPRDEESMPGPGDSRTEDPVANTYQLSMENAESRRTRRRVSQMGSTPEFHQVLREASSNENMPTSPSPSAISFGHYRRPGQENRTDVPGIGPSATQ
ncbi:hypothetical protein VI817_001743 [Penicillium citrinum]|nr:hypothetical protein VI817_001743 [Penicillium citrinum]